jgi:ribose transport system permease protein
MESNKFQMLLPKLKGNIVYLGFIAIFLFFSVMLWNDGFLSVRNLSNIVLQTAPATIMAIGLVFVLSSGEIDLSFGSIVAVSALTTAVLMQSVHPLIAVAGGLGVGVVIGAFNGFMVAFLTLPSFLVTLATMALFSGVARTMTDLRSVPAIDPFFTGIFGSGKLFGVPSLVIWTFFAVVIGHIVYTGTRFGAHVIATGDNPRAALVSGIRIKNIRLYVLMLSGFCAGLAGVLYTGRIQAARYTLGESDLMIVIAAVIVGGTALHGGKGSVVGALVGSLLMGMLNNGLILMEYSVSQQIIVRGVIILLAVAISLREPNR